MRVCAFGMKVVSVYVCMLDDNIYWGCGDATWGNAIEIRVTTARSYSARCAVVNAVSVYVCMYVCAGADLSCTALETNNSTQ